ncbi:hypothetical protein [Chitinimonas sp. JJ19]|uniref:hypothetical protein n=1 Tax=Chitinimonas sp. JJ19 TaxID=3109352 RepID=UPI003002749C
MNRKGSGDQQPFFAPIPVPPVRPAVRRPLNPNAIPYVPLRQRQSRAYMYTPFANEDSLKSALGENMVRIRKGKQAHGLLAPSHKMADNLEAIRQQRLQEWGGTIHQANQTLNNHAQRGRAQDALLLDRIKRITDHNKGSPLANMKLKASQIKKQQIELENLKTEKVMAQSDLGLHQERFAALQQTRILNTSAHLYPQLYPDPPLQHLAHKDKLYVLGHGAPDSSKLYATQDGKQSMDVPALREHLKQAGLPKNFVDLRLTACQGVPPVETPKQREASLKSNYLVPTLYQAIKEDFPRIRVTGYAGNGVTFPFNSDHHLRSAPHDDLIRGRRKELAVRYPS